VDPFIDFRKLNLYLGLESRACRSLAGIEQQVIYRTSKIPRIDVCLHARELAECDGHVPPVWMRLHRRNGFLNNQGNALMDKRVFPSATTKLQQ
jgi:hypothetical protein